MALRAAVNGCKTSHLDSSINCTQLLIDAGANLNTEEPNEGKTPLMMACKRGYLEMVSNLLNHGAMPDLKDQKGRSALMYAIDTQAQNEDVVEQLLATTCSVNEPTKTGETALLLAVKR